MLPSKGYFRTIECPFYSNNLCHRVYCHFHHGKKASVTSSEDKKVNFFINNKMKSTVQDNHESCPINDYNVKNDNSNLCKEVAEVASSKTTYSKGHTIYLQPQDLPSYNPTPISQLKTRDKLVSENIIDLQKTENINSDQTKAKKLVDFDSSDLVNNLAKYLIENDVLHKILSKTINGFIDPVNESANTEKLLNSNILEVPHEKRENFCDKNRDNKPVEKINEPDSHSENYFSTFQSIVTDLTEKGDKLKQLEQDFLNNDIFIKENDNHKFIANTEFNNIEMISNNSASNNCKIDSQNSYDTGMKFKQKRKKYSKSRHQNLTKLHETLNKTVSHKKHKNNSVHDIGKVNKFSKIENCTKKEKLIEVILVSDSEDSEAYDEFDKILQSIHGSHELNSPKVDIVKSTQNSDTELKEYDEFNEILKSLQEQNEINSELDHLETNQNSYYSQVKTDRTSTYLKKDSLSKKIKTTQSVPNIDNDLPQPKKKIRIAHRKTHDNTVTMKTTEEYLSYWQNVKERTKYKCVNPSGTEGYQNWSNVKISPVLNVSSLLNSKKLLYAKIDRLKSNKR